MKKLLPVILALLGLAAGIGAGIALKPAPEPEVAAAGCAPAGAAAEHGAAPAAEAGHGAAHGAAPAAADCAEASPDPFAAPAAEKEPEGELTYFALDKPFVVPVFKGDKTVAMVVLSLSVETDEAGAHVVEAAQPRLRDSFLKALFRHANSGGFDGSYTEGQKMEDLKAALLGAAREVGEAPVGEVLITEIARQDV